MTKNSNSFYTKEKGCFKYSLGNIVATSLSGFIAGVIVVLIIVFALCDIALKS